MEANITTIIHVRSADSHEIIVLLIINGVQRNINWFSDIDMKTNVSFSQIELTINHTDIKYVHCHAPVLRSTNQWRNTSGWVLMRGVPLDFFTCQVTIFLDMLV
jgi:hypothetical protein